MRRLKLGVVGLGQRGFSLLKYELLDMAEYEIVAVCDDYEDRIEAAQQLCNEKGYFPKGFSNPYDLMHPEIVDCVFIATPWLTHIELSIEALKRHIPVAMEVGGAYDIHELWKLVEVQQETQTPFMFMENCCYGRLELLALNMVEQGVLGELVHLSGGYLHDLRDEISEGYHRRHYRIDEYQKRNAENYPTHEIGPIAKILGINRGNRFVTISSQASKSVGLRDYIVRHDSDEKIKDARSLSFNQADVVVTTLKCANGELVTIKLDTTLPRYYSRGLYIQGTKGLINEENQSVFLEEDTTLRDHFTWKEQFNNLERYYERYEHPIWKNYLTQGVRKGHDGMDYLVFKAFADALINDEPMPIDVYDAATWMAITTLSEQSISLGGQVLPFPDFTLGKWTKR
ncbi:Gfo/Idh/MocA family oxidoreductase [Aerococcaceae bacterium zg-ZJ1578]|uniref:Gfo/Idh/MocA family protein n=1 Tax=Aerococcaceae bacterium zg-252 TaxID=2796928 RepID=UPI001A2FC89F|nr:Gfo/Idh/MocA family oxidoreductase [Aerococcaceae bacterium zg-1578]